MRHDKGSERRTGEGNMRKHNRKKVTQRRTGLGIRWRCETEQ